MNDIIIPDTVPDFDKEPWLGSVQQLLKANVGKLARIEYGNPTVSQQGVIYAVGTNYILLWDESRRVYQSGNTDELRAFTLLPEKRN